jgi:membrane protease YdiL (CAAX protease family)
MKVTTKIFIFFVLSWLYSWSGNIGDFFFPSDFWKTPMISQGPILAAITVIFLTEGWKGLGVWLRRVLQFKAPLYVYGAALFGTLAIIFASVSLTMLISGDSPKPEEIAALPSVLMAAPMIVFLGGPFGEEPGFRGYGQHTLHQVMSPLTASLWVGLGVLVWHIPQFVVGGITPGIAVAIVAVSVVYAWLYQAGGSVWPLIVLHGTVNTINGVFFGRMLDAQEKLIEQGFISFFFVCWAVFLAWRLGPTLGHPVRGRESAAAA